MADALIVQAGTTATFYAVPPIVAVPPATPAVPPITSAIFANQWQVSVGPSALTIVTTPPPKSFFKTLAVPTQIFGGDSEYKVLASISILLSKASTILELLATYSFLNPADDFDVNARFVIRDSVSVQESLNGIMCSSTTSATTHKNAAGAVVFRGNFAPGLHNFTLETKILGGGRIVVGGVGENGNASLYIQQLDG